MLLLEVEIFKVYPQVCDFLFEINIYLSIFVVQLIWKHLLESHKGFFKLKVLTLLIKFTILTICREPNLHFFEDEFVPYAVLSDQTGFKLRLLPTEGKVQQPFFQRSVGLTEHLVRVGMEGESIEKTGNWVKDRPTVVLFPLFFERTDPVEHAVEQTRDHREDCGLQSFQVVHQKFDVSLEKADSSSVDEDDALTRAHGYLYAHDLLVISLAEHLRWC